MGLSAHGDAMNDEELRKLEQRLGALHARQRLGIEIDHEAQIFGQGLNFFHLENWYAAPFADPNRPQADGPVLTRLPQCRAGPGPAQRPRFKTLPRGFDGFTLLHISDLHVDMNEGAMRRLAELLPELELRSLRSDRRFSRRDLWPVRGDARGHGGLRAHIKGPVYGVLGNHDTIRMVPASRRWASACCSTSARRFRAAVEQIYLAGIDDAHFYRVDNIEKAAAGIPRDAFSILLSHTPEIYRQAAHADFDLLLSGHTHGGQICLPGSESRSRSIRCCRADWGREPGPTTTWSATRRSASDRRS